MGLQVIGFLGGYQDGSLDVNPLTADYKAGQPLKVNTSGQLQLCFCYAEGTDTGYCGLAKGFSGSTSLLKSDRYNGKATYIAGYNKLKLDAASLVDAADHVPYDSTLVYNEGDDLYIDENGLLSNNGPGAHPGYATVCDNATPIAYVVEVGSLQGYLIINQVR